MKKLIFGGIALFFFAALISCTEKQPQNDDADIDAVPDPLQKMVSALVLEDGISKWTENEQGIMVFEESSELGELVQVFMIRDHDNPDEFIPEMKTALRADFLQRDFYHVMTDDGQELWMQDYYLAVNAVPGIILTENTFLYSEPDASTDYIDARKFPQYHFVGIHESESNDDFLCVSAFVYKWFEPGVSILVEKQYVRADAVTSDPVDAEVLNLLHAAESLDNKTQKQEVLINALLKGGNFNNLIVEAFAELGVELPLPQETLIGEEPNDTLLQAYPMMPGSSAVQVDFMTSDDTDWYKITIPSENSIVRIYTESKLNTIMSLYNGEGELIAEDDDSGHDNNAQIAGDLYPETYYIDVKEINGDTGAYSLYVIVYNDLHGTLDKLNAAENDISPFTAKPYVYPYEDYKHYAWDFENDNAIIDVRNKPGISNSKVIFTLPSRTEVVVIAETNEKETIDGYDYAWLQVTVPSMENRSGWIYDLYVINSEQ